MEQITVIVRREKEEELLEQLKKYEPVLLTSCLVEGCGIEEGVLKYVENGKDVVMLIPKAKIELLIEEEKEDDIVKEVIGICRSSIVGDGKIFIERSRECLEV